MADDFDVEAMLEAPYKKVGLTVTRMRPLVLFCYTPFIDL